ncbi:MAG: bifunctional DNA-formamidopyrimidine glycosylase/DNA-(apurinic or apyrimidinic site) lyase [Planctomycetota bacterium]|nr:bifunctional DNA-formamidopyrimidine glycosylase/DNA-(apurinic or apyrimidinic site) lyase [Planctomycetota bacterium]MDG2143387.1 bifunctional DNA-formamidopyrimidine glycosylase/DNA-(apurinic or apyrimidinic site) lyase [Planctomycetota bacterium]
MPELPEVETMVRLVRPKLMGRSVTGSQVAWARTLGGASSAKLRALVHGRTFLTAGRRAKYILLGLSAKGKPKSTEVDTWLVIHLRMTGRLMVQAGAQPASPHTRVSLTLDNGARLEFIDPRKFGRFVPTRDLEDAMPALGPEPLEGDFTAKFLLDELAARRGRIKSLLLDQSFLAGLGNIYVDESLFEARIHPQTPANRIPRARVRLLHAAIRRTLEEAILREGSSFDTFYRTPEGQPGSYQSQFQVYGRHGKPCRVCSRRLNRIVVAQRGTHFCPSCQRLPRSAAR